MIRILLAAGLLLTSLSPAFAAQPGAMVVSTQATAVNIEVNKGRLVRLEQPVTSVFLADPAIADVQVKSPTLVYVFGKKSGETSLFAVDGQDQLLANFRLTVTHNLSALDQALRKYIPDAAITVSSLGDAVVLSGAVKSPDQAEDARSLAARLAGGDANVINRIAVRGPNQINLRVRIAEVQRSVIKQLGINWEAMLNAGSFAFGLATGNPVTTAAGSFITRNNVGGSATNSLFGGFNGGNWDVNGLIDALESEGLMTVLAEPNLTATNGETASFLAGGEFPVPVPQDTATITIEFKKFGVGLAFTPTLLADGRINLRVRPEVSQLTSTGEVRINNFSIPALTTRRAETTVELGSGQSFAIAGLIQNNVTHDVRKFPGLGDLPILGALFRSDGFRRNETELVIMVTPYIVKPVSNERMVAAPTDGLVAPSDGERIASGALYKAQAQGLPPGPALAAGRRLIGPTGFMLD
ncbi:MAG: type II and III secretion system protein family protein [Alphaproteobacteria bacterium]